MPKYKLTWTHDQVILFILDYRSEKLLIDHFCPICPNYPEKTAIYPTYSGFPRYIPVIAYSKLECPFY